MTESDANLAWHYTSSEGLLGILKNHVIWASSAAFMNDFNELLSGSQELRNYFEQQRDALEPDEAMWLDHQFGDANEKRLSRYVLSASTDGNSLTHWRYYGGNQVSYAIGFDPDAALVPLDRYPGKQDPHAPAGFYDIPDGLSDDLALLHAQAADRIIVESDRWAPVEYDREKQLSIIKSVFDNYHAVYAQQKTTGYAYRVFLADLIDTVKAGGFKDEKELRVLVTVYEPKWKFVNYRSTKLGVVPYVELAAAPQQTADHATAATYLPIRHIRIGPAPFPDDTLGALRGLLNQNGYHAVKVSRSNIPFRQT